MAAQLPDHAVRICNLCIDLSRRNRVVDDAYGTGLVLFDVLLLVELSSHPYLSSQEIAETLTVSQSGVARILTKLRKGGFISLRKADGDPRRLTYQLAAKGRRAVAIVDEQADKILTEMSRPLSAKELKQLREYIERFCDGGGVPRLARREHEHPLRTGQRRIARLLKVLKVESYRTLLTPTEHFLLRLLRERRRGVRPKTIAEILNLQTSNLSVMLSKLKRDGAVIATRDTADARSEIVSITDDGLATLDRHEEHHILIVRKALHDFSATEAEHFADLFTRFVHVPDNSRERFRTEYSVKPLVSVEARTQARAAYLLELARRNLLETAPEYLFDPESRSYGLFQGTTLRAALQIRAGRELAHFSLLPEDLFVYEDLFREEIAHLEGRSGGAASARQPPGRH